MSESQHLIVANEDIFDDIDEDDELGIDDTAYASFRSFSVTNFHALPSAEPEPTAETPLSSPPLSTASYRSFKSLPGLGESLKAGSLLSLNSLPKPSSRTATLMLILITSVMVAARSIDFVLYIRMSNIMKNYDYYLSTILLSFAFCLVSWPVVAFKMYFGQITQKERNFPKRHFVFMGILDSLGNLLGTIAAPYLSGSVNLAITQIIIPMNVVASFFLLKMRYKWTHMLSLFVVMGGVTITILPKFFEDSNSTSEDDKYYSVWILLTVLSYVPQALSNVYKEAKLQKANLDVWFLNAWVALFQLLFGMIIAPIIFIRLPPPAPYIVPSEFMAYLRNALLCTVSISSEPGDTCSAFPIIFLIFLSFNMCYNILILVVFKRGSSTLAVVASAARLVLSELLFLVPFIAGAKTTKKVFISDMVALVALVVGIVLYQLEREHRKPKANIKINEK